MRNGVEFMCYYFFESTYGLFFLPRFHCCFIFLEFVTPVRVDLLEIRAFAGRRTSVNTLMKKFRKIQLILSCFSTVVNK